MTKFQTKLTTAFATGAVLLQALAPFAAAQTTLTITGNGSDSTNTTAVANTNVTTVVQSNTANINNNVSSSSNTGNNDANDNTGGDVNIDTGDATTDVSVTNVANSNAASVDNCCQNDVDVTISGNGTGSTNDAALALTNTTTLFQTNEANVSNNVDADSHTGNNDANDNTDGNVRIDTGNAETSVTLSTLANANSARVGGGEGAGNGTISAIISGNGSHSDNSIALALLNDVVLTQDNVADVDNDVDADARTGDNDANDNTGGEVDIDTGNATTDVTVDTMVNFNGADLDNCACLTDLEAKIAGNGTESENDITYAGTHLLTAFQENDADVDNSVDADSKTGYNDAEDNTGDVDADSDPSIDTGDAESTTELSTTGNSNTLGDSVLGDLFDEFDFDFDWSGLLGFFLMSGHHS